MIRLAEASTESKSAVVAPLLDRLARRLDASREPRLAASFACSTRHYRCNPATAKTRIEAVSDVVASELLLPARHFQPDLATAGLTADGIEWLADRYIASLEATALRAVDLWPRPALLLVLAEARSREKSAPRRSRNSGCNTVMPAASGGTCFATSRSAPTRRLRGHMPAR